MNFINTDSVKNCIWYQMIDQVSHQIYPIKYKIEQEINK